MFRLLGILLAGVCGLPAVSYGYLPLSFELNQGQADPAVRFLARGVTLAADGVALMLPDSTVRMKLIGASPAAEMVAVDELPGKVNYFIGSDPALWRTNIPTYAKVRYRGLYPGVDLVFYGRGRRLEYDFTVSPGADASVIQLAFEGADSVR